MPFTQVVTATRDYLLFIGDGSILNAEELLEWCMAAVDKARESGHKKLLFDNRTLTLEMTQHDVLMASNRMAELNVQLLGFRFAVVSSAKNPERSTFIETAFVNRSATYKNFDTQKDALEWLLA